MLCLLFLFVLGMVLFQRHCFSLANCQWPRVPFSVFRIIIGQIVCSRVEKRERSGKTQWGPLSSLQHTDAKVPCPFSKVHKPFSHSRDTAFPPCQTISSSSKPSRLVSGHSMVLLSSKLISLEGESHYRKEGYCKFYSFCYTTALSREICVFCQGEE